MPRGGAFLAPGARVSRHGRSQAPPFAPQGVTIGDKKGGEGGVIITGVSGNGAKAGLKVGDTVLYTSSFFGDELWPADKAAFTRTAINAKQNDVDFVRAPPPAWPMSAAC